MADTYHRGAVRKASVHPLLAIAIAALPWTGAAAQQENPVYVDDSPQAWELFRLARDHARDNVGEAVRIYQELLDEYGPKLLPANEGDDAFVATRFRVLAEVAADDQVLSRLRLAEDGVARRLLAAGDLRRLALTRPFTVPGLEALLRLAQDDFEHGYFHAASRWLDEASVHPDLAGRQAVYCWYMIGAVAHYLGQPGRLNEALRRLDASGPDAAAMRRQLDRLVATPAEPAAAEGVTPLDVSTAIDLDQLVGQPIWSALLEDTPLGQRAAETLAAEPAGVRLLESLRQAGALLTAAPTVAGSTVYVNEGRRIDAFDRYTGRPVWPSQVERRAAGPMEQGSHQIADLNIVAVSGNTIVTLTGHAFADSATSDRAVVCLDAETGAERWAARMDVLSGDEEMEGLFPCGAPVIGDGVVYVGARKVSKQLLTSKYVVALDLADGSMLWARHIATSGGIRARLSRPISTIVPHDGDLAVATAIGAVARIDLTTGLTRWLRRYNPPLSPLLSEQRPWEMTGPVVTDRGVIAIRPDYRRIVLLDWETGHELDSASATNRDAWNSPQYLLADDAMVYGVGSDVRAFRPESIEKPAWTFPPGAAEEAAAAGTGAVEIRGRVALIEGGLIVPTSGGIFLLDAGTGAVVHRVDVGTVGNPLAVGPQLILATSDRLQAYMPLDRAEQMLRQQMAAAPLDPGPALALMKLAVRVRNLELALEAADLVVGVITRATDKPLQGARQELFDILLELDREQVAATRQQGEALHAMIGLVAQEPLQRVEHLLAYGDWLATRALGPAVEAYQTILSSPDLARTPRRENSLVRPASAWAAARIAGLIQSHGRSVYQPQADFARVRLAAARGAPEALSAVAVEFPFADAAVEAAAEASSLYAAAGDRRRAVAVLAEAYLVAPDRRRAAGLIGRLVRASLSAGWKESAEDALRYVTALYGDIVFEGDGQRRGEAWLAELVGDRGHRLPRIGEIQGGAERLAGALVVPRAPATAPPDRAVLFDPPQLTMIDGNLQQKWATVLAAVGEPTALRFDGNALLLWLDSPGDDPRLVMIDPADGSQRWTQTVALGRLPEPPLAPERAPAEVMPGGEPFDPAQVLPLIAGRMVVAVRRSGQILALDLDDPKGWRWRHTDVPLLERVYEARLGDTELVLAGARRSADGSLAGAVIVLDPETGRVIGEFAPRAGSAVRWMQLSVPGLLVYGNVAGVEAVVLPAGRMLWAHTLPDLMATPRGWAFDGSILVESSAARPGEGPNPLRAIRPDDGSMTDAFGAPTRGDWDRVDLREVVVDDGRIFGLYGQRVVRFAPDGTVMGADVISDQRNYRWVLPGADRLILVSLFTSEQVLQQGVSRGRTEHTYRLYALSPDCKLLGEPVQLSPLPERLTAAALVDGRLLLSTGSNTLVVGLPVP